MADQAAMGRDEQASRLYRTYAGGVFATCLALLGDREDAADATHEVFARALPQLERVEHPCAWLQTAARHHCADVVRRRQVATRHGVPPWGGSDRDEPDPAEVVTRRHEVAALMAGLPERERRILAHVGLLDAPVAEIATRMRMSYAAARQLLVRARHHAAQARQLPSAVSVPPLARVTGLARRLPSPLAMSGQAAPRGVVAGGAVALCASLLCASGGGHWRAPVHPRSVASPSPPAVAVAPIVGGPVAATVDRAQRRAAVPVQRPTLPPAQGAAAPPVGAPPLICGTASAAEQTVWTHGAPDQGVEAQSRLVRGTLATSGDVLAVRIYVEDMSLDVPAGATGVEWQTELTANGNHYFIRAHATATGTVVYSDQTRTNIEAIAAPDSGSVHVGPGGYAEVDVPFAHLGISRGSVLADITASSFAEHGQLAIDPDTAVAAAPYVVGSPC